MNDARNVRRPHRMSYTTVRDKAAPSPAGWARHTADLARPMSSVVINVGACRSACSAVERFAPRECGRDVPRLKLGIEVLVPGKCKP